MTYLTDLIRRRAELTPDRVALEEGLTGRRLTYGALDARVGRATGMLHGTGIRAGDRIAIACRNRAAFFETLFACARLGAVAVPLNWRSPATELAPLLAECGPRLLLYGAEEADLAQALCAQVPGLARVGFDDAGAQGYEARLTMSPALAGREHWPDSDVWYLLYTSGTTGKPKAVIQTYRMALINFINAAQATGLNEADVAVSFLPLFHTAGINLYTLPALITGARVILFPQFDAEAVIGCLRQTRVSVFFAVPTVYQMLSQHPAFDTLDLATVRSWSCGGAPMPETLVRRYAERGALVCAGFGMTETGPTAFMMDRDAVHRKPGSVGKLQIMTECRIVTRDGQTAKAGEVGELWMRGSGLTPGYWRQPEQTAAAFTQDGWLRTGDLARMDCDGYFYISGRIKDMYVSGGENIYPAEVEAVLTRHPEVLDAAVIAQSDPIWGEVGLAYVEPRRGLALGLEPEVSTLPARLTAFCREHLAPYKVPRTILVATDLPRTATGKIRKHALPPLLPGAAESV